ncbi:hypothetical protein [Pseudovibrio sp. POLY-S9]|uniref:hypothetical protein n=1 Tax=Pseudovibrio sp. POLY-S9 TaxID=1576596 RepID=UPI00070F0833|nr:hypothetical protein [Pseudovibrio sp. POLY-S9]
MKIFLTSFIILLFAANYQANAASVSSLLSKDKCIKLSTLLEVDMERYLEEKERRSMSDNPCDAFGLLYILGLGLQPPPSNQFDINVGDGYQFYYFSRVYLMKKAKPVDTPERMKDLNVLRSFALAALSDEAFKISEERKDVYRAFHLRELLFDTKSSSTESRELLNSFIDIYAYEVTFRTWGEVDCFIKHDIPKYSVEEIKKSSSFLHCIQNLQKEEDG